MSNYYNFLPPGQGSGSDSGPYQQATTTSGPSSSSPNLGENISDPSQSAVYYNEYPEHVIEYQPAKSSRSRRKSAPGPDHIKHRRTRSGCFTCRGRRVKCDEARPICERCRKGKRDCVYPEPSPTHKSASSQKSKNAIPSEEDDDTDDSLLTTIPDEDGAITVNISQHSKQFKRGLRRTSTLSSLNLKRLITGTRQSSETPSLDDIQSPSPIISSTSVTSTPTNASISDLLFATEPDWSHLPSDFRAGLDYFRDNITYWNYGVRRDIGNFFQTTFLNLALRNEALLNAVLGFSTYQRTLKNPNGKIQDFLKYYQDAVTLLIGFLKRRDAKHDLATLLTILQLATIEEYLGGDWTNLTGHRNAALEIFTQLFTAETIAQTSIGRILLMWYVRLDVLVSTVGSTEPKLPRQWAENVAAQYRTYLLNEPENLDWLCEDTENQLRLLYLDACCLNSGRKTGKLTQDEFGAGHEKLSCQLRDWRRNLDPLLTDPSQLFVPSKQGKQAQLFHYFQAGTPIFKGELTTTTALLVDWHSLNLVHMTSIAGDSLAKTPAFLAEMAQHAEAICQIIEAAEQCTIVPKGLLVMLHPPLAAASLYVVQSPRRHAWLREKFAWLESCGYILPASFRVHMVQLCGDETILRWWLPDDKGFTPIVQSVRAFANDRNEGDAMRRPAHLKAMDDVFDAVVNLRLHDAIAGRTGEE